MDNGNFEKSSRVKLRFNYKGLCNDEDLWDIPLRALDTIFKELNLKSKAQNEESLLNTKSAENKILDLKIAIVKHIVEVRLAEKKTREDAVKLADRKEKILGIIAEKQDASLRDMSLEDLAKLVE